MKQGSIQQKRKTPLHYLQQFSCKYIDDFSLINLRTCLFFETSQDLMYILEFPSFLFEVTLRQTEHRPKLSGNRTLLRLGCCNSHNHWIPLNAVVCCAVCIFQIYSTCQRASILYATIWHPGPFLQLRLHKGSNSRVGLMVICINVGHFIELLYILWS